MLFLVLNISLEIQVAAINVEENQMNTQMMIHLNRATEQFPLMLHTRQKENKTHMIYFISVFNYLPYSSRLKSEQSIISFRCHPTKNDEEKRKTNLILIIVLSFDLDSFFHSSFFFFLLLFVVVIAHFPL